MDLSVELKDKTKALAGGDKLSFNDRLMVIQDIADRLIGSNLRPIDVVNDYGVTYNTAYSWLESAYTLLEKENKYSREGLRAMHKGQIERRLNELGKTLDSNTLDLEDKLKIHDRYIKYLDARARITGLNTETVEHSLQQAPLQIIHAEVIDVDNSLTEPLPHPDSTDIAQ